MNTEMFSDTTVQKFNDAKNNARENTIVEDIAAGVMAGKVTASNVRSVSWVKLRDKDGVYLAPKYNARDGEFYRAVVNDDGELNERAFANGLRFLELYHAGEAYTSNAAAVFNGGRKAIKPTKEDRENAAWGRVMAAHEERTSSTDYESKLEAAQTLLKVRQLLGELQWTILVAVHGENVSPSEVARQLGEDRKFVARMSKLVLEELSRVFRMIDAMARQTEERAKMKNTTIH